MARGDRDVKPTDRPKRPARSTAATFRTPVEHRWGGQATVKIIPVVRDNKVVQYRAEIRAHRSRQTVTTTLGLLAEIALERDARGKVL